MIIDITLIKRIKVYGFYWPFVCFINFLWHTLFTVYVPSALCHPGGRCLHGDRGIGEMIAFHRLEWFSCPYCFQFQLFYNQQCHSHHHHYPHHDFHLHPLQFTKVSSFIWFRNFSVNKRWLMDPLALQWIWKRVSQITEEWPMFSVAKRI